jgi:uncharacterized small protein (DUF1192 family)
MTDDEPRRRPQRLTILPLDELGVGELRAYIGELQAEIARSEAEIARKQDRLRAAESVFGRRS